MLTMCFHGDTKLAQSLDFGLSKHCVQHWTSCRGFHGERALFQGARSAQVSLILFTLSLNVFSVLL